MKAFVALLVLSVSLIGASPARAQAPAKGLEPIEAYRAAAEKQISELRAKAGSNGSAEALSSVKDSYETARRQQAAWVEVVKASAAGAKTAADVDAASTDAAKAVFACVQARRTALGQPALAEKLAAGVENRIIAEYRSDSSRRLKALKGARADAADQASRGVDALLWKPWEDVVK